MFEVEWLQSAVDELTRIWTAADSALRQDITAASNQIDQQLENNPHGAGESRPGGRRILFVFPLGVVFRVEPDDKTVTVLGVWLVRRTAP